jgi:NADH-quinone oxidoreductase subunit A
MTSLQSDQDFHFMCDPAVWIASLRGSLRQESRVSTMLFNYANVLVFILFSLLFVFGILALSKLLAPRFRSPEKLESYECGELPTGSSWLQFNIRFYIIAIAFLIFDVEIAFMFPVARIMREYALTGLGWFALAEMLIFVFILFLGLIYLWRKGDLDWVKELQESRSNETIQLRDKSPASSE